MKDYFGLWRCQAAGCTYRIKATPQFDLHLICKHIDGGLRWYCMHPLCQGKSWAASSTKIAKQHEETYHSDDTNEGYKLCHLRHPESLDEHLPQRIRMSYDAMPWVEQSTGAAVHPDFIKRIALDTLRRSVLGQFYCTIQPCNDVYTSVRKLAIHLLTTHFNYAMACPIGCGVTFITLQTIYDHLKEVHMQSYSLLQATSIIDVNEMNEFLNSHTFIMSETARRVYEALQTNPSTVFFIDVETTVQLRGQAPEAIEISVIDGNNNIIVNTLVDYGLTIDQMFHQYSTPPDIDFRYRALAKVLGPPSENHVSGYRPEEIIEILKVAGMNKDSFLVDWSMSSFDWHALKRLIDRAGKSGSDDTTCLPLYKNSCRLLMEWKHNMPGISCSLEKLFPLVFPNDKLIGMNHRSLPDTEMLVKLARKFFDMCEQGAT